MNNPNDLAAFLDLAWLHLSRGVADAKSPARFPTFATVTQDGKPMARTVAMRRADRRQAVIEVHTDIATPKVAELTHTPYGALHFWLPKADLQMRVNTRVEIVTGEQTRQAWDKVPPASRVSYGTEPLPGTPIKDVYAYEKPALFSRFAVLICHIEQIDLVELGPKHRRAGYDADTNWQGHWRAP
ncbi:MAG: pyridoxamine 5'-phosphate oxidase family protein [Paracoccaceae bacterium]